MSTVSCPGCQTAYPFQPQLAGKKTRCAHCKQVFAFPSAAPVAFVLPTPQAVPAASPLRPLRMAAADGLPALQPLAPTPQVNTGMWDDVPALLPSEGRPMASSFSANAAPIYRGETRGASLPCGSVPPQFGEVVVQAYYRTPAWKAVIGIIVMPIFAVLIAAIGLYEWNHPVGNVRSVYAVYIYGPPLLIVGTIGLVVTAILDQIYPRVIAITRLGLYMPRMQFWWGMQFLPYGAGMSWSIVVEKVAFSTFHILEIHSDFGKYRATQGMFASRDEFEEFVHALHQIYPGRL